MRNQLERIFQWLLVLVTKHNSVTLLLVAAAAVAALSSIVDLRSGVSRIVLDTSSEALLPDSSPERTYYNEFKEVFQGNETMMVVLSAEGSFFESAYLESAARITERIESLPFVDRVSSLSTALNIRSEGEDLRISPFLEDVPTERSELDDLRRRALADPIYAGNLFSHDGKATVVLVYFVDTAERELIDAKATDQIAAIVAEERGGLDVWYSGSMYLKSEYSKIMLRDIATVVPLSWLVMGAVALFAFRTIRGVIIPVLTVQLAILAATAFVALSFGRLNTLTVGAPPILVAVGFAYAIHVLAGYYDTLRDWPDTKAMPESAHEIVRMSLEKTAMPILFAGITTAAGFFSLITSPITAVQEFGMYGGVGALATMLVSLTAGPALLCKLPVPDVANIRRRGCRTSMLFDRIAQFDISNRARVIGAWGVVSLVSVAGMFLIEVRTDTLMQFRSDSTPRVHFELVNSTLEGGNAFNVVVQANEFDAFKKPENLATLDDLQVWLERQPEVGGTTSIVDYVKAINRGFHDVAEDAFAIPTSQELVAQLLLVGANHELDRFIDGDYEVANLVVRTQAMDSGTIMSLVRRIEERLSRTLPGHLSAQVTGNAVLVSRTADDVAVGQAVSLGVSFVFIYALLAAQFRSLIFGLLALIPSALPVLAYFGVLGLTGVPLSMTTALVACIVLGLAVDDTIHLMTHFKRSAIRHGDEEKGMIEALHLVGRPISSTTVALALGFLVIGLSESPTQQSFGALAALTVVLAWLADVTLTPVLAIQMKVVASRVRVPAWPASAHLGATGAIRQRYGESEGKGVPIAVAEGKAAYRSSDDYRYRDALL